MVISERPNTRASLVRMRGAVKSRGGVTRSHEEVWQGGVSSPEIFFWNFQVKNAGFYVFILQKNTFGYIS